MNRYDIFEIANFATPIGTVSIVQEYAPPAAFKAIITADMGPGNELEQVIASENVYRGDTQTALRKLRQKLERCGAKPVPPLRSKQ